MTRKKKILWAFLPAVALVAAGFLALRAGSSGSSLGVILLWPGILAALFLNSSSWGESVFSGHPFLYDLHIAVAAVWGWGVIGYLVLSIIIPLAEAIRAAQVFFCKML
jgi:hypothetical protein